jgi:hypothetical protein
MKLSVEAKVAGAVAAGFLAVTVRVVVQGNRAGQPGAPNDSSAMSEFGVRWYVDQQGNDPHGKKSGHQNDLK